MKISIIKFYDREYNDGGWVDTPNPDYDPNKKNWLQRLWAFINEPADLFLPCNLFWGIVSISICIIAIAIKIYTMIDN